MRFETIWSAYQSSLKAFLHSRIANPEDAEDLLQEILIKTYNGFKAVTDESKIKPWLFQIANNTIIDFYRKNNKRNDLAADNLWYDEQDKEQIIKALSHCLLPFINQLPEEDSELLVAIEIEGVSIKEYAENNGINYSTLKSRVKKSRKKLYNIFHNCCDFAIDTRGYIMEYNPKSGNCDRC